MCVVHIHVSICVEVEGNFEELVLSFYWDGPGDGNLAIRLGGKHLYPLSPLTSF